MTSFVPKLDDMEFEQLVEQGRGLIPRYAPQWTDHNLHDPGITLIDLIAWLVDQQIYRIDFVGDSLRAAFTRLMGITPRGPRPAEILIWSKSEDGVLLRDLRAGTEVSSLDAPDARYTLAADVRTVKCKIKEINTWTNGVEKPLGTGLTAGRDPFDLMPARGGGPQMLELVLNAPIPSLADDDGPVSLGFDLSREAGDGPVVWDKLVLEQWDPKWKVWRSLGEDDVKDGTAGLRKTGVILFRPLPDSVVDRFRLRLDLGFRPGKVTINRIDLNVLPAREGWDDPAGVIGKGTGLPDQVVEVETTSIVDSDHDRTLIIKINETEWKPRADLLESGPEDEHYRLTQEGIVFGNGINGKIVPADAQIRMEPVRRTCGGDGAVSVGLEWQIAGELYGTNIAASTPGRNPDGLKDLLARARQVSRTRQGMLTADSLRELLMSAGLGLSDVQVSARRRPGLDGFDVPGSRTVLILPERDPEIWPDRSRERLRDEVETVLKPLRLLGERLYVSPPIYLGVTLAMTLVVEADADAAEVRSTAEGMVRARLWDVRRREDVDPWPAGRDVTVGEFEGLMAKMQSVVRVTDCRIAREGAVPGRETIELGDREIALARAVTIKVLREGTEEADVLPVWLDVAVTLVVEPGTDKADAALVARNALRSWSQTGGVVSSQVFTSLVSASGEVSRVFSGGIAVAGKEPGKEPIPLSDRQSARVRQASVEVLYPSDGGVL
jgi:hypothetical protein